MNFPVTDYGRTLDAARILVAAASAGRPHIVYPGNTWVFGRPARPPITPNTPFSLPSAIARIKAHVDETLMRSGLPVTVAHLPDFYGPGVSNKLMEPLFLNPIAGKNASFPGPVNVPHEFIYIDDAAQALLVVSGQEKAYGRRYTVSATAPITVREFSRLVYQASGTRGKVSGIPGGCWPWPGYLTPRPALPGASCTFSRMMPVWMAVP